MKHIRSKSEQLKRDLNIKRRRSSKVDVEDEISKLITKLIDIKQGREDAIGVYKDGAAADVVSWDKVDSLLNNLNFLWCHKYEICSTYYLGYCTETCKSGVSCKHGFIAEEINVS